MRAPDTHDVYRHYPDAPASTVTDPADLGTAFGLDASLPPDVEHEPRDGEEAPLDWLGRRRTAAPC